MELHDEYRRYLRNIVEDTELQLQSKSDVQFVSERVYYRYGWTHFQHILDVELHRAAPATRARSADDQPRAAPPGLS